MKNRNSNLNICHSYRSPLLAISLIAVASTIVSSTTLADVYKIDLSKGDCSSCLVKFIAVGNPSQLKIEGKSTAATGQIETTIKDKKTFLKGTVDVSLGSFVTGLKMRDNHMKEKYLEVGKFPKATLSITDIELADGVETATKGKLSLHGKDIDTTDLKVTIKKDGDKYSVKGNFTIDLEQFGIAIPSFAGITVAKTVTVDTELLAVKM